MMLALLGLNHTTAPLQVREKLAFDEAQRSAALRGVRERFTNCEVVLLCTCNRVELYVATDADAPPTFAALTEFLAQARGVAAQEFSSFLYHKTDRAAVAHLFSVASSLDSMVLGETQILGQVREAYDAACALGTAGALLNPLFQRALAVGKQVLGETTLAQGRMSIASVAVDYARRIFDGFSDKTVLSIGAGKMAGLLLGNLAKLGPGTLLVCNRDAGKAAALAQKFVANAVPFEELAEHLAAADIIVSSTASGIPIITRPLFEAVMRRRRYKPVYVIDIAVPRDVAPAVGEMENVYLYNLDDLQQAVAATRDQRNGAVDAANQIVSHQVQQYFAGQRAREMGPLIDELFRRSHALAQEELARTLGKLADVSPAQRRQLEDLARRIVNKLLHDPIQMLRQSQATHAPMGQYLHAMEKLFNLDADAAGGDASDAKPDA
jgi:glutamyl-tRNA reductase